MIKDKKQTTRARYTRASNGQGLFRRNAAISSTNRSIEQHKKTVTQRQIEKKQSIQVRKIKITIFAAIVFVFTTILFYRFQPRDFSFSSNASSRMTTQKYDLYNNAIEKQYFSHTIAGQYWLLDEMAFKNAVLKQFPEIQSIEYSSIMPVGNRLNVQIRFRRPNFAWHDASGSSKYIDSNGVLFDVNLDAVIDERSLVNVDDQSGIVLDSGTSVISDKTIRFIGQLHKGVAPVFVGKSIVKVIVPASTREVHVQIKDVPYIVKFSTERSLESQTGELKSLMEYLVANKFTPGEYVDLRVANKAFYR